MSHSSETVCVTWVFGPQVTSCFGKLSFLATPFPTKESLRQNICILVNPIPGQAILLTGIRSRVFRKDKTRCISSFTSRPPLSAPRQTKRKGGQYLTGALRHPINCREETELPICGMRWHFPQQSVLGKATYVSGMEASKSPQPYITRQGRGFWCLHSMSGLVI